MKKPVPLVDPVRKFALYTNGKCGGTSVKEWFLKNIDFFSLYKKPFFTILNFNLIFYLVLVLRFSRFRAINSSINNKEIRKAIDFYRKYFSTKKANDKKEKFKVILVTRNPYERVVSAFVDKFCGEDMNTKMVNEVISKKRRGEEFSFHDFLNYLISEPEERQDPHWRRQTYVVDNINIDFFVRLESIKEDLTSLSWLVGDENLYLLNKKRQSNNYRRNLEWSKYDVAELSQKDIIRIASKIGSFPDYSDFLEKVEIRDKVEVIYSKDFEVLPYLNKFEKITER